VCATAGPHPSSATYDVGDDLEVPREVCISIDLMVEIAIHFFETGELLERACWKREGDMLDEGCEPSLR
jgi:hypothetical protein